MTQRYNFIFTTRSGPKPLRVLHYDRKDKIFVAFICMTVIL